MGIPFELHLLGPFGEFIASGGELKTEMVRSLTVELHTPSRPERHLDFLVVDLKNHPVANAQVSVLAVGAGLGKQFVKVRTNAEGQARFAWPPAGKLQLSTNARGFTRFYSRRELADDTPMPIRLQIAPKNGRLVVHLLDAHRRPAQGRVLWRQDADPKAEILGQYGGTSFLSPGRYQIRGLQMAPVHLDIYVGGQRFQREVPAGDKEFTLQLPPTGQLVVSWSSSQTPSNAVFRVATLGGLRPVSHSLRGSKDSGRATLRNLMPGKVKIALQCWVPAKHGYVDVSEILELVIKSGQTKEIKLAAKTREGK